MRSIADPLRVDRTRSRVREGLAPQRAESGAAIDFAGLPKALGIVAFALTANLRLGSGIIPTQQTEGIKIKPQDLRSSRVCYHQVQRRPAFPDRHR